MYEHKSQPLLPLHLFYQRVAYNVLIALFVLGLCLLIGVLGYHHWAQAHWIDAFHNAAMILSGMGPVLEMKTWGGKIFSSLYALFSGVVFITNVGLMLTPAIHQLFHRLHLEEN